MRKQILVIELLEQIEQFSWEFTVYTKGNSIKNQNDFVLIIDDDAESERDSDDEPLYATENGFTYYLGVSDIQDVKTNLQVQDVNYSIDTLLAAIEYYRKNDAFVRINS